MKGLCCGFAKCDDVSVVVVMAQNGLHQRKLTLDSRRDDERGSAPTKFDDFEN